jgi:GxxExxY protein
VVDRRATPLAGEKLNRITSTIITVAIEIHRAFGPGLFESAYLACLCHDLRCKGLYIEVQKHIPLIYGTVTLDCAYRADVVVEDSVLVEVKALETLAGIHTQQVYTYLRLGAYPIGLLLNFGAPTMKAGIKRVVNNFPE